MKIALKFVPEGPINNVSALVHMMDRGQAIIWTNDGYFTDTYVRYSTSMSL